jgi:phosphoglycolate phosphatase
VQTVIFDLDGVLIDSGIDIVNAVNFTLQSLGRSTLPFEQVIRYIGPGMADIWRQCLGADAEQLLNTALPIYKARYSEYCAVETTFYPGIPETLSRLKARGMTLAVATNKLESCTRRILEGLDLARYFDTVVGAESLQRLKPDPEAVQLVLARLGASPETTVFVGDASTDIQAAKAARTISCGVTYGFGSRQEIIEAHPDFMIDRAEELSPLIL